MKSTKAYVVNNFKKTTWFNYFLFKMADLDQESNEAKEIVSTAT